MSICRIIVVFVLLFSLQCCIYSQDITSVKAYEDSVRVYLDKVKKCETDSGKIQSNSHIFKLFKAVLIVPESFTYRFDSLKTVGKLISPDGLFRIITWNFSLPDGTYKYFGIIQFKNERADSIRLYELTDRIEEVDNPENSVLSAGKWYGALYYNVLKNKVDNYTYYTILGLRYNNLFTTTKLIEVLYFDQFGNPVFGAPIFNIENKIRHRMVFQFSARVTMNLTYNEKLKMIVFDHLSPSESKYTGQYMHYGPDFSYDGLFFKDKKWQYKSNLDLKRSEPVQTRKPKLSNKLH